MTSAVSRVIVVGAGLSGLACARMLVEHGRDVVVLDKGRGPGGRASTRQERSGGRSFDHGAQFFTARSEWLVEQTASWEREGVIASWAPRGSSRTGDTWWVGTPGMGSLAAHLARGLDVRTGVTVTSIARRDGVWAVNEAHEADALVIAVPAPQCAALLGASSASLAGAVAGYELDPCWAVMVAVARTGEEPLVDLFEPGEGPLAWAAREASKPGRGAPDGEDLWTLHASAEWSRAHLEDDADDVVRALALELAKHDRRAADVRYSRAHRWRFARARTSAHQGCLHDPESRLALCGDWLESARVEGAFTSGRAAAARILAGQ